MSLNLTSKYIVLLRTENSARDVCEHQRGWLSWETLFVPHTRGSDLYRAQKHTIVTDFDTFIHVFHKIPNYDSKETS